VVDEVKADAIKFIAYTGLRIEEFFMLTKSDIDLENGVMRVFNVKTDKVETIPLLKGAREILQRRSIDEMKQYAKMTYNKFIKKSSCQGKVALALFYFWGLIWIGL